MKALRLMDFESRWYDTDIDVSDDSLKQILAIKIEILSGDFVATIVYEDGEILTRDVCSINNNFRIEDFADGERLIYSRKHNINIIDEYHKIKKNYDLTRLWEEWDDNAG